MQFVGATIVHIEVHLSGTTSTVFDAWGVPKFMQRWLFVGPSNRILEVTSDERVGGKFYIREENDGVQIDHFSQYLQLERPILIELALEVPRHFQGVAYLKVELREDPGGCSLALTQTGAGPSSAEEIWRGMFSGLQRVLLDWPGDGIHGT